MGRSRVRWIMAVLLLVCVMPAMLPAGRAEAKKVRQKLRVDKESGSQSNTYNHEESGWTEARMLKDSVAFSGYDKPVGATKEAILISNRCQSKKLRLVRLEITYKDMQGRMLHSRTVDVSVSVPPGETRKGEFKSWDSQKTYYYHLSQKPRRAGAPYQIEIHPIAYAMEGVK